MKVGMLWLGSNAHAAKEYFIKKYKRIPDTVEVHSKYVSKLEIKNGFLEGLRVQVSNEVQIGNILLGLEKDEDISEYIKSKEG
jgi:hypothetical protein